MATSVYSDAFSRLHQDLREAAQKAAREDVRQEVREEVRREGRRKDAIKILGTVMEQDQLARLENTWRQSDWFPNLDAVLAVRDGMRPWTSLFPSQTPSTPDNGRHDG